MSSALDTIPWWIPIATLLIGAGLTELHHYRSDQRQRQRDKEARSEARRDAVLARRIENQRATLPELQEVAAQYGRFRARAYFEEIDQRMESAVWGDAKLSKEVDEGCMSTNNRMQILSSRTSDPEVRRLVSVLQDTGPRQTLASSSQEAYSALSDGSKACTELNERIGIVLRQLDSSEDELGTR